MILLIIFWTVWYKINKYWWILKNIWMHIGSFNTKKNKKTIYSSTGAPSSLIFKLIASHHIWCNHMQTITNRQRKTWLLGYKESIRMVSSHCVSCVLPPLHTLYCCGRGEAVWESLWQLDCAVQTRQAVEVDWLLSWCLAHPLEMEHLQEHIETRLMVQSEMMTLHRDFLVSWKYYYQNTTQSIWSILKNSLFYN